MPPRMIAMTQHEETQSTELSQDSTPVKESMKSPPKKRSRVRSKRTIIRCVRSDEEQSEPDEQNTIEKNTPKEKSL